MERSLKLTELTFPSVKVFFQQMLLSGFHMPGTVLGMGNMAMTTVNTEFIVSRGRKTGHIPIHV